jgi:gliding motility-associated-like protein
MLFYPNVFSPNGDGKNDVFVAIGNKENVFRYHQLIFDRWGQVIFETTEPDLAWDGKYGGKPMPSGVYVYKVNYRIESSCVAGQDYSKLATITLLK